MDIWSCSAWHLFHLGPEHPPHRTHHQFLLLSWHLPINQLHEGAEEEDSLRLPPALGVHEYYQLCITHYWRSSLVTQQLYHLGPQPEPGCPNSKAQAKYVFHCLHQVRVFKSLVRTRVHCLLFLVEIICLCFCKVRGWQRTWPKFPIRFGLHKLKLHTQPGLYHG